VDELEARYGSGPWSSRTVLHISRFTYENMCYYNLYLGTFLIFSVLHLFHLHFLVRRDT
jgi:hypothetical protein